MIKKLSYCFYKIFTTFDKIFFLITKKSLIIWFRDFIQEDSYKTIIILDEKIKFFIPNQITDWRVKTFFKKEPETLEWIDTFEKKDGLIFWDIGANIGLYSIYNALRNKNSITVAFEPSSSNLRVLTRNISINNFETKIFVVPTPLSKKENIFQKMYERDFIEGGALNSFGEQLDFKGERFLPKMKYSLLGTSINYLIENSILEIPDYIKIDVDGIEHLILEGGNKFLGDKKIKSISVEINENFKEQHEKVLDIMRKCKFEFKHKKFNDEIISKNSEFDKTFNYIFIKN